jgi:hypothetical protein
MFKKWLHNDKISLGIILGLVAPIPVVLLFMVLLRLFQTYMHLFVRVRDADMFLLGLAVNLIIMRYYFVKLKFEKTGKTLLVLSVILILLFFVFLKNSTFTFPF